MVAIYQELLDNGVGRFKSGTRPWIIDTNYGQDIGRSDRPQIVDTGRLVLSNTCRCSLSVLTLLGQTRSSRSGCGLFLFANNKEREKRGARGPKSNYFC